MTMGEGSGRGYQVRRGAEEGAAEDLRGAPGGGREEVRAPCLDRGDSAPAEAAGGDRGADPPDPGRAADPEGTVRLGRRRHSEGDAGRHHSLFFSSRPAREAGVPRVEGEVRAREPGLVDGPDRLHRSDSEHRAHEGDANGPGAVRRRVHEGRRRWNSTSSTNARSSGRSSSWGNKILHGWAVLIDKHPIELVLLCMAVITRLALVWLPALEVNRALVMAIMDWVAAAVLAFALKKISKSRWPSAHTASAAALVLSALFAVPREWPLVWGLGGAVGWFFIFFTGWGRVRARAPQLDRGPRRPR